MSMPRRDQLKCPKCGYEIEYTRWQSLNGDLDPEAKQQLLDGSLFKLRCDNCGYEAFVDYDILYNDMTHEVMIYLTSPEAVEQTIAMYKNMLRMETPVPLPKVRYRIVTDQNSLREKAHIFNCGLDDRVIELIKLFSLVHVLDKYPDANIRGIYFLPVEGKYMLEFIGDDTLHVDIPDGMYDEIKEMLTLQGNLPEDDGEFVIDQSWAQRLLKSIK